MNVTKRLTVSLVQLDSENSVQDTDRTGGIKALPSDNVVKVA